MAAIPYRDLRRAGIPPFPFLIRLKKSIGFLSLPPHKAASSMAFCSRREYYSTVLLT